MRKDALRIPNLDGSGEPGSPGVEKFLGMMASHVSEETPITPSPATMLPSSAEGYESRIANLEYDNRILRRENAKFDFAIRNLEAAVFGQPPPAKKQKH